ncbi:MAG: transketolase [Actinobacteria bacterium]|nr:transketolase [Actinomycetota bacterium]
MTAEQDQLAIALIRGLALDAPLKAKSGHQGTAMSLAPLAHVLYSRILQHDPSQPQWLNRDRFILSNGHASILQYALLYLGGWGLSLDDLKNFRQWDSATPGHPEVGHTAGVEVTTGPLGQGFANAVGMAIAESHLRSVHGADAVDHHTYVIVGDGCLMEGVSHEAASLAGHLKLDHLVCVFDDNKITIDGSTDLTCSDDVPARFRSYGWNVIEAGEIAEDCDALESVLLAAKNHSGAPTMIVLRTHIGFPSPEMTDKHEAHGNPFTAELVTSVKKVMGIPDEPFWAPEDLVASYRSHVLSRGSASRIAWESSISPAAKKKLDDQQSTVDVKTLTAALPVYDASTNLATRQAFQKVIEATDDVLPHVIAGAADLTGNTGAKLSAATGYSSSNPSGKQVYYGIREHAMGAAMVGMALHGGVIPVGGTFFVFADYMRPSIRLAALSGARCVFVFSHDSVGVGEDGPTHQPIEHLSSLRSIPGLQVIRPADPNETAHAWLTAVTHDGPTAIILSRQNVPSVTDGSAVQPGAAIIKKASSPVATVIGTGSEVGTALEASVLLEADGIAVNVVSLPSWERFLSLPASEREAIIPTSLPRISVEAGSTFGWTAIATHSVGIDRFGASAPGNVVMEKLGISASNVAATVKRAIA